MTRNDSFQKLLAGGVMFAGIALASVGILSTGARVAAQPAPAGENAIHAKGSENKGRYYFRGTCKDCHTKGAVGGEITPLNKTQAQWKTYFVAGKHARNKELLTKIMSDEQLRDVEAFLYNHAADSLQPETCGK
jgi:cytochrome c5